MTTTATEHQTIVGPEEFPNLIGPVKWLGPGHKVKISVEMMSAGTVDSITNVGANCKYSNGATIESHHNHRHPILVTIVAVSENQLTVDSSASLGEWFTPQDPAYRCGLGVYNDGILVHLIHSETTPAYSRIDGNVITLYAPLPAAVAQSIIPGKTKITNHFSTCTYHFQAGYHTTVPREWTTYSATYDDEAFNDAPGKLRMGTAEVSLAVLANYGQDNNSVLLLRNPTITISK